MLPGRADGFQHAGKECRAIDENVEVIAFPPREAVTPGGFYVSGHEGSVKGGICVFIPSGAIAQSRVNRRNSWDSLLDSAMYPVPGIKWDGLI
jgi:hypothetical protein